MSLFKKSDVSNNNWNLSFMSATKYCIFCSEIFFTLTNSAYTDEMPYDDISPVCRCKQHEPKNKFRN